MKKIQENELECKLLELRILDYQQRIALIDEQIESIKKLKEKVVEYMNLVDAPLGTLHIELARILAQTSAEQMEKIKNTAPPPPPPNSPFSIINDVFGIHLKDENDQ
jgi:hypothetical protein